MSTTRDDVITYARDLAGLSAWPGDVVARAAYLELIAPAEPMSKADAMALDYGCGLVQRGILRRFISHDILEQPYRVSRAISDLVEIARRACALHGAERTPKPGDIVIEGGGIGGGGPEHTWMVLADPDVDGQVEGLDGGQLDEHGSQCVLVKGHRLVDGWDQADSVAPGGGRKRKVRFVLDLDAMLQIFGREPRES